MKLILFAFTLSIGAWLIGVVALFWRGATWRWK